MEPQFRGKLTSLPFLSVLQECKMYQEFDGRYQYVASSEPSDTPKKEEDVEDDDVANDDEDDVDEDEEDEGDEDVTSEDLPESGNK
jgi:hypothetical protein